MTWAAALGVVPAGAIFGMETTAKGQAQRLTAAYKALAKQRKKLRISGVYWFTWATDYLIGGPPQSMSFRFSGLVKVANRTFTPMPVLSTYRTWPPSTRAAASPPPHAAPLEPVAVSATRWPRHRGCSGPCPVPRLPHRSGGGSRLRGSGAWPELRHHRYTHHAARPDRPGHRPAPCSARWQAMPSALLEPASGSWPGTPSWSRSPVRRPILRRAGGPGCPTASAAWPRTCAPQ